MRTGTKQQLAGVILAGGLSRRMGGGDKALLAVDGRTILERVVERAVPQVSLLILSANGDPARFDAFGLPVVEDSVGGFAGPLAGILAGLEWVGRNLPAVPWMASFAADTPMFPADLVERLLAAAAAEAADIACAASGGMTHPVFGLWPVRLAGALRQALVEEDLRKVGAWTARYRLARVEWPGGDDDPFFNVNTPEDLAVLRQRLEDRG